MDAEISVEIGSNPPDPVVRYRTDDGVVRSKAMVRTDDGWTATIPAYASVILPIEVAGDATTSMSIGWDG